MASKAYHGVEGDKVTGIYTTWSAAKEQVDGFSGECRKGFETLDECVNFMVAIKCLMKIYFVIVLFQTILMKLQVIEYIHKTCLDLF